MPTLTEILKENEDWLMERVLQYALRQGYSAYTSTLKEPWRQSISGLTASITAAMQASPEALEMHPEDDFLADPAAQFGIIEARRHRTRGVSLSMFLGLMKYYRQSYIDLLREQRPEGSGAGPYEQLINRVFDRIEIGFCVEWTGIDTDQSLRELQTSNLRMTNEKNKYLTIFESIPTPVFTINRKKNVEDMNLAATRLFDQSSGTGSQYYCIPRVDRLIPEAEAERDITDPACFYGQALGVLLPWLADEIDRFYGNKEASREFEKSLTAKDRKIIFRVKLSQVLDISEKFAGTIIILEDITTLKNALDEVKTLRGFVPICSSCKKIRDDEGFWQQVEQYVQNHSEARFSHSICPECARRLYPDMDL